MVTHQLLRGVLRVIVVSNLGVTNVLLNFRLVWVIGVKRLVFVFIEAIDVVVNLAFTSVLVILSHVIMSLLVHFSNCVILKLII